MSDTGLIVEVVEGDVLQFAADVLALKYAQHYYGSDEAVCKLLVKSGVAAEAELKPAMGEYVMVDSSKVLPYANVLLVGVPLLRDFDYTEIQHWARRALSIAAEKYPSNFHVAITLHGPGYGLDEVEALHAEIRGIISAAEKAVSSGRSIRVSVVEHAGARVERLQAALAKIMVNPAAAAGPPTDEETSRPSPAPAPAPASAPGSVGSYDMALQRPMTIGPPLRLKLRRPTAAARDNADETPGAASPTNLPSADEVENKPRVAVAMPFAHEMDDIFYYGIQNPVRQLGYICERIDEESFTGDILDRVKMRIEMAEVVIADLTGANPNVYLEVGYAWGKGRPTVLIANKKDELKFDVRGQRCLKYESIRELETTLTKELKNLSSKRKTQ